MDGSATAGMLNGMEVTMVTEPPPDFAHVAKRLEEAVALVKCALYAATALDLSADKDALQAARTTLDQGVAAVYAVVGELGRMVGDGATASDPNPLAPPASR